MTAYATYAQWLDYLSPDISTPMVAGTAATQRAVVEDGLLTASAEIDQAAAAAGYTVPLVVSDLTDDVTLQGRISAQLRIYCCALATAWAFQPINETDRIKAAREAAQAWLAMLRAGTVSLAPAAEPVRSGAVEWIPKDTGALNATAMNLARRPSL